MKKIAATCVVSLALLSCFGQQDPLYSQYLLNPFIINPAYAGFTKNLTGLVAGRSQWSAIEGSPTTVNASLHCALAQNKMGLGFIALKDAIGSNKITEFHAAYAYRIEMENKDRISFGLQAGGINYRDDYSALTIDPTDPKFQKNISETTFSIGAGIIYNSERLLAGISIPKMLNARSDATGNGIVPYGQTAYGHLAYIFDLTHQIKMKPFVMARYMKSVPINADAGGTFTFKDSYTLGLFTRNLHTFGLLAKLNIGDILRVGYVFELPTGKSVGANFTAHEITIGIQMKIFKQHELFSVEDF